MRLQYFDPCDSEVNGFLPIWTSVYDYWNFNNSLVGGYGHDFTCSAPDYQTGKFGNCLRVGAAASSSPTALTTTDFPFTEPWSLIMWIKLDIIAPGFTRVCLSNIDSVNHRGFRHVIVTNGRQQVNAYDNTGTLQTYSYVQGASSVNSGNFTMLDWRWTGTSFRASVNSSLIGNVPTVGAVTLAAGSVLPLTLGLDPDGSGTIGNGFFYEALTLWTRCITDDEVIQIFNAGAGYEPPIPL